MDTDIRQMFVDTAARLFSEQVTRDVVNGLEKGTWPADLWKQVEEAGLAWAAVPESAGGAGGSIGDLMAVLREAGRNAVPLPLAETGLGAMMVAQSGLTPPVGPLALVIGDAGSSVRISGGRVTGSAKRVPFASIAGHIVVVAGGEIAVVAASNARIATGQSHAGEPYDDVTFENAVAVAAGKSSVSADRALQLAALARANQMAGAAERVLAIVTQYSKERVQFGRSISTFQAVQHMLADMATHIAATSAAARTAAYDAEDGDGSFSIMAAKTQAGEAANRICAIAHQSMGAMGYTYEHTLHHYTRRLWVWRRDYGSETVWATRLGQALARGGADSIWASMTASRLVA